MKSFLSLCALTFLLPCTTQAEATFSGELSMGLRLDGDKVQADSSAKLTAKFSGVTDGGLEYGAVVRLDPATAVQQKFCGAAIPFDPACDTRKDRPGGYVYISGGGGTLAIGQTNSATREVIGTLPPVGY
jgi:hypothetical protein